MHTLTFGGALPQRTLSAFAVLLLLPMLLTAPADAAILQYSDDAAMRFEANQGQLEAGIEYASRGRGYQVYLTKPGAVIVLQTSPPRRDALSRAPKVPPADPERSKTVLRMSLLGAQAEPRGVPDLPTGTANYLLGNDPSRWRTVPSWARVRYENVYPGIDLVYYGNQRRLEYDFVVRPGADPSTIRLALTGSVDGNPEPLFHADADGSIVLHAQGGEIRLRRPHLYQEIGGIRQPVTGSYVVHTSAGGRPGEVRVEVGFRLGAYDTARPLVIDPVVDYSTYLGGSDNDAALTVAVDAAGNAYVAGYTESLDFPADSTQRHAGTEAFVAKIDAAGGTLVYSTYLGGSGSDGATGIAVDATGAAYVTGYTASTDFPVVSGYQGDRGAMDAFVARLTPNGSGLAYSTYLGGSADDAALAIAIDGSGNAYVTGWTASTDFPRVNTISGDRPGVDVFVARVNTNATGTASLVYSSYLGGGGAEEGHAIAVDGAGRAYVVGWTDSENFPKLNNFQGDRAGRDGFISVFSPGGAPLVYSSYLGGNGTDQALGVAVDGAGRAYVTGTTDSTNFWVLGAVQPTLAGLADAFLTIFDPAGVGIGTVVSSTYLGGTGNDIGHAVALDSQGRVLVAGVTTSPDFPTRNPLHGPRGGSDAFIAKIDPFAAAADALTFSSYLGGAGDDMAHAIAVDSADAVYVAGVTTSANFPAIGGVASTAAGLEDAFLAKLSHLDEAGPDLKVTSIATAGTAVAGEAFTINDVTANEGQLPASATVSTFYLSTDQTLDEADVVLGTRSVPTLPAGATSAGATTVTIPATTGPGRYYVIAKADAGGTVWEGDEENNTAVTSAVALGPDLTVPMVLAPAAAGAGTTIVVSNTVKNAGGAPAAANTARFHLSTDTSFDPGDVLLGTRSVPALAPGAISIESTSLSLPANLATGKYYVIVTADGDYAVPEADEANNRGISGAMSVGPDLVISSVTGPSTAAPGEVITVTERTTNQGGGPAGASTTTIYLSTDTTLDPADVMLGSRSVPELAGGASSLASSSFTVPPTVSGRFYVIVKANADEAVVETDSSNNVRVSELVDVGPDLVVTDLSIPTKGGAGLTISVTDAVQNRGTVLAGASTLNFFLSTDAVHDAGDVLLGSRVVPSLPVGAESTATTSLTIPSGTVTGHYQIIAVADADNVVAEMLEDNNTKANAIAVGPNLDITVVSAPPRASAGSVIAVTDTTRNRGGGAASGSATRFYFSANTTLDGSDTLLGNREAPTLAADATSTATTSLTVPATATPGSYYILAVADALAAVTETDETDNVTSSGELKIGADLAIDALTAPVVGYPGATIVLADTIVNLRALAGASTVKFFVSVDATLDTNDVLLGSRPVPPLDHAEASSGTTSVTLPLGLAGGTHYIIALADADDVVAEMDETNNTRVRPITVGADLVVWLDLAGSSATATPGQSITVTDSTRNQSQVTVPPSTTRFFLSADATLDPSDIVLGSRAISALDPGATSVMVNSLTLPQGIGGTYYLFAQADADHATVDSNRANNTSAPVAVVIGTDLVAWAELPAGSSRAAPGGTITVNDTTKNESTAPAPASTTTLYLSQDQTLDASDLVLGSRAVPPLAAGALNSGSTTVTLPATLAAGTYYVLAKADGPGLINETNETNNALGPARAVLVGADMVVTLDVPGAFWAVPVGATITVTDITRNTSPVSAVASTTRFHLSADTVLDAGDLVLGSRAVPALAADTVHSAQTALPLPAGLGGVFYVIAQTDADNVVAEVDKTNNTAVSNATIKIGPDLIASLDVPAASFTAAAGGTITVTNVIRNNSAVPADASTARFSLSGDTVLDAGDVPLGTRVVPALAPFTEHTAQTTLTVPAGLAGAFHLIVQADADSAVVEVNETNNTAVSPALTVGTDLVAWVDLPQGSSRAAPGGTITINDTTKNESGVPAPASTTTLYLSQDQTLDATDIVLGSRAVPPLAPGATDSGSTTVTLPATLAAGTYYVLGKADGPGVLSETNESNNALGPARAVVVGADMVVTLDVPGIYWAVPVGATITVTDITRNTSPVSAVASTTRFHLSADTVLDAGDLVLGSRAVPALAADTVHSAQTALPLPAGLGGVFYVIAQTDADNVVAEVDKTNNTAVSNTPIKIGPDLIIGLDVPSTAVVVAPGTTITVTDVTRNNSAVLAAASTVRFFLSVDAVLDAGDVMVGSRAVPSLAPYSESGVQTAVTLPTTLGGTFYLIARADADGAVVEVDEGNNTAVSYAMSVGTDLMVFVDLPGSAVNAASGGTFDVTSITRNGSSVTAPASVTRIYLSTDTVLDPTDIVLASRSIPALAPSGESTAVTTLTLPAGLSGGAYYVITKADADNTVVETNEGNNVTVSGPITLGADITVSLDIPAAAFQTGFSATFNVTDVTRNGRPVPAPASVTRIYLSTDMVLDGSDVVLGSRSVPALAPFGESTAVTALTLPAGLSGVHYLITKADADNTVVETNEGNNVTVSGPITLGADITVSLDIPAAAFQTGPGASFTVTDVTRNGRPVPAPASVTRIYLSTDTVLDDSDLVLGSRSVPALAPLGNSTAVTALTLPAGLSGGAYYVIARADADNAVTETDESNNVFVFPLPLNVGADLIVFLDLAGASSVVAAGSTITVTDYTKNEGAAPAGASTVLFYLSQDTVLDPGDTPIGSRAVPSLAPGATSAGTNLLTLPGGIAGLYYVLAQADATGVVAERYESNNVTATTAIEVGPDLVITGATAPAKVGSGATVYISDTTKNRGAASAGATATRFFLSADAVLDAGDLMLGARAVQALTPLAYQSGTTTVVIPSLPAGRYYLIVVADGLGDVAESNEGNNAWVHALDVLPDFAIPTITAPSKAYPGSTITVADTLVNSGAAAPATVTAIFLSPDTVLDAGDLLLGVRNVPAIGAGATSVGEAAVALPIDLAAGTYYLIAVADAEGVVAEVNEANNTRYKSLTIGPDLTVSQLTVPASAAVGATIVVSESTKNLGSATSTSTTRYYLSADATLGSGDTLLGSRAVPPLAVGETSTGSVALTIPGPTVPGAYYVIAQSDADGAVPELVETNNSKARTISITP